MNVLQQLESEIRGLVSHSYLKQYIATPMIDRHKLAFLHDVFSLLPVAERQQQQYTISSMLVHMALDTHDKVAVINEQTTLKTQQLTVLAGDYFSGLHYVLLAQVKDITMIQTIARAIKIINEQKIKLYQRECQSVADLLKTVVAIEASIIHEVVARYDVDVDVERIERQLLNDRLQLELLKRKDGVSSLLQLHFAHLCGEAQVLDVMEAEANRLQRHLTPESFVPMMSTVSSFVREEMRWKLSVEEG